MLFTSLQLTVRNLRGITRVVSHETFSNIQTKHYARFTPRHATIVNEDELFDVNVHDTTPKYPKKIKSRPTRSKAQDYQKEFAKLEKETIPRNKDRGYDEFESSETVAAVKAASDSSKVDADKVKVKKPRNKNKAKSPTQEEAMLADKKVIYTKLDENDKKVGHILMDLKTKKGRKKKDQILLEGTRFIKDAIYAGMHPEIIIFSRWEDVKNMDITFEKTKFYKVPYKSIQVYSSLTTCPGIMGIFDKPAPLAKAKSCLPITIICDNIRDPGNMGSIMRAAAGVGCEKLVLTKGCVDFWGFKVLRTAAGAHFRLSIHGPQEWSEIKASIVNDVNVYVADNNTEYFHEDLEEEVDEYSEEIDDEMEENNAEETKSGRGNNKKSRQTLFVRPYDLPLVPYYAVDYTKKEIVLIVGGETKGLSKEAYDLVHDYKGTRVNVPLDNKIESLNAGMALGIVAFEIKRQFSLIQKKLNNLPQ